MKNSKFLDLCIENRSSRAVDWLNFTRSRSRNGKFLRITIRRKQIPETQLELSKIKKFPLIDETANRTRINTSWRRPLITFYPSRGGSLCSNRHDSQLFCWLTNTRARRTEKINQGVNGQVSCDALIDIHKHLVSSRCLWTLFELRNLCSRRNHSALDNVLAWLCDIRQPIDILGCCLSTHWSRDVSGLPLNSFFFLPP